MQPAAEPHLSEAMSEDGGHSPDNTTVLADDPHSDVPVSLTRGSGCSRSGIGDRVRLTATGAEVRSVRILQSLSSISLRAFRACSTNTGLESV